MRRNFFLVLFALSGQISWAADQVQLIEIQGRMVPYVVQDGFAITQGDIILGRSIEIEAYRAASMHKDTAALAKLKPLSIASTSAKLWPDATSYYVIDSDVAVMQNILDAIAYWNAKQPFQIMPRTNQTNYIHFRNVSTDAACESSIGMVGGEQFIGITPACTTGSVIHEIGHSWGLLHEQERADRGAYITVLYENIDKRYLANFNQSAASKDLGYYDFDSIMHYGPTGFARNFQDTMDTVPVGIPIGQRVKLSAGDLDQVLRLYGVTPAQTTITTTPEGLPITVDGQAMTSPQSFAWSSGSSHSVSVPQVQGTSPRYVFARWSDHGDSTHNVVASSDVTVFCAQYSRQYPVQAGVASGQGTAALFPISPDGYLPDRYPFLVSAQPAGGSGFVRWTGNTSLGTFGLSVSNTPAAVEVTGITANYQATFTNGPITTVDSQPRGALVLVDGLSYFTPANFSWAPSSTHTLDYTATQLQGTNSLRYQFVSWEDGSTGPRTVTATSLSATYTAKFNKQYLVTSSYIGTGSVTLSPSPADGFYDEGTVVQVVANPGSGQTLRYWLGDLAGNNATTSITADQTRFVIANFGANLPWLPLNSATFTVNPVPETTGQTVAPGELVSIFGAGIGPTSNQFPSPNSGGALPTTVAGVSVTFDQTAAPITFAGPNQINVVAPFNLSGKTQTSITVRNPTQATIVAIAVAASAPGLFTFDGSGRGPVAAFNQDGSVNSVNNPAAPGSVVILYGTGAGTWTKSFPDGQILGSDLASPTLPVYVRFGKLDGQVYYAGTAPYLVNGALQINATVPPGTIGGEVPLQIVVGTYTSAPGTTIWIK